MPGGDKSKSIDKQEPKADHILEGYEERGDSEREAQRRAWAAVDQHNGGVKKAGGRGPGNASGDSVAHKRASFVAAHRLRALRFASTAIRQSNEAVAVSQLELQYISWSSHAL